MIEKKSEVRVVSSRSLELSACEKRRLSMTLASIEPFLKGVKVE